MDILQSCTNPSILFNDGTGICMLRNINLITLGRHRRRRVLWLYASTCPPTRPSFHLSVANDVTALILRISTISLKFAGMMRRAIKQIAMVPIIRSLYEIAMIGTSTELCIFHNEHGPGLRPCPHSQPKRIPCPCSSWENTPSSRILDEKKTHFQTRPMSNAWKSGWEQANTCKMFTHFQHLADLYLENYLFFNISRTRLRLKTYPFFRESG